MPETKIASYFYNRRALGIAAIAGAFGFGTLLGRSEPLVAMPSLPAPPPTRPPPPPLHLDKLVAAPPAMTAAQLDPRARELLFPFTIKKTAYVRLANLAARDIKHGTFHRVDDEGIWSATAPVADTDVPAAQLAWKGRRITVDNHCTATVTGFAIVGRLIGEPVYADVATDGWTIPLILDKGTTVLAARLDGCAGTFDHPLFYARDAALPSIAVPIEQPIDAKLAARARSLLVTSRAAAEVQKDWATFHPGTRWNTDSTTQFITHVLRHPTTGTSWISIQATAERGCGNANVDVWGLFRIEPTGELVPVQVRPLGDITVLDALLDVDNDGQLELLGRYWVGLVQIYTRLDGKELGRLGMPYYGCPC